MYPAIRLTENQDLKKEIIKYADEHNIVAGAVLSGVGCLKKINVRTAKALKCIECEEDYEIVSLMGTISKDGVHLHISLSDEEGVTIGGHLKDGNIINTTCELVIIELPNYEFSREFDENTGYDELVIRGK
ncbi:MAG: DNA-binding protein [Bacilli bacterium]|nr:DNA-binding protein [Bacilli bacterium]